MRWALGLGLGAVLLGAVALPLGLYRMRLEDRMMGAAFDATSLDRRAKG